MKYLILTAAVMFSTAAFAEDATQAPAAPASEAAATPATAQPEPPKATPAPAAAPVQPSVWVWSDIDAGDLANLNACAQELPKRIADQWISRLSQHIKAVK